MEKGMSYYKIAELQCYAFSVFFYIIYFVYYAFIYITLAENICMFETSKAPYLKSNNMP